MKVKDARRTATTMIVRSSSGSRISLSMDPFYELMRRLFKGEETALRAKDFLMKVKEAQLTGDPIKVDEWREMLDELKVSRSSFYSMRNKLLSAGLIDISRGEYRLSGKFSKDMTDMARWWWGVALKKEIESL
ncbi:MAG: hypothetical protein MASP_01114 [Candidatus Methanolliviera sp. GoM_asphalt]|nr:MAG: hypothetical protein MASP_01114 [Candidatus Methanolliviera sp. GoM_asphalt]